MRALFVLLIATSVAAAQPGLTPVTAPPAPEAKSPDTALWLSIGVTGLGLGLVMTGADVGIRPQAYPRTDWLEATLTTTGTLALLAGPSLGRIYGGARLWNGGFGLRLFSLGFAVTGVAGSYAFIAAIHGNGLGWLILSAPFVGLGAAGYLAGSAWEIATTPRAVRAANREHGLEATLTLTPIRARDGLVPAIGLAGRF